jgi:hypothetical protein
MGWFYFFFVLAVVVAIAYAVVINRKSKVLSDDRLAYYRSYLAKPVKKNGDKQNSDKRPSKPFKTTTATLPEGAESAIKTIFTPQMLAEFEEGYTALLHRLALRAIDLEQVLRKQTSLQPGESLTADDVAILVSEGLREAVIEPEALDVHFKRDVQIKQPSQTEFHLDPMRAIYD